MDFNLKKKKLDFKIKRLDFQIKPFGVGVGVGVGIRIEVDDFFQRGVVLGKLYLIVDVEHTKRSYEIHGPSGQSLVNRYDTWSDLINIRLFS